VPENLEQKAANCCFEILAEIQPGKRFIQALLLEFLLFVVNFNCYSIITSLIGFMIFAGFYFFY
jgi:hypothetical protein